LRANIFLFIAIVLSLLILVGSLTSLQVNVVKNVSNSDKLMHIIAYGVLNISWLLTFKERNINNRKLLISTVVLCYGIIIEVLQGMVTNYRQADFYDILANFIGISLSIIIFNLFLEKKL